MANFYCSFRPHSQIVPGEVLGYVMQHNSGPDLGFSWNASDPNFSDAWTRIPVGAIPPAPKRVSIEALDALIAETAHAQGIDTETVAAFGKLFTAIARSIENYLLAPVAVEVSSPPASATATPATDERPFDDAVFSELLANLLDSAETSKANGDPAIYAHARQRLVQHLGLQPRRPDSSAEASQPKVSPA